MPALFRNEYSSSRFPVDPQNSEKGQSPRQWSTIGAGIPGPETEAVVRTGMAGPLADAGSAIARPVAQATTIVIPTRRTARRITLSSRAPTGTTDTPPG